MVGAPAEITFLAAAASVQLLIGIVLILGDPRNERVAVLGGLFVLNGIVSTSWLARQFEISAAASEAWGTVGKVSEFSTNIAILLLAFVYPWRPRWLSRAPHAVWFLALAILTLAIVLVVNPDAFSARDRGILTAGAVLGPFGIVELAFPLIMLRWASAWTGTVDPVLRRQFALVFAALGLRAAHMMLYMPVAKFVEVYDLRGATMAGTILGIGLAGFVIAALITAMIRMVAYRPSDDVRPWHLLVLAFLVLGLLEGAIKLATLAQWTPGRWGPYPALDVATTGFDVYVVRPALIWLAVARYQLFGLHWHRPVIAWSLAFVMATAVSWKILTVAVAEQVGGPLASALSLLIAATLAAMGIAVARLFAIRLPAADTSAESIYEAQHAEAYRHGTPDPKTLARLATWRRRLQLEDESPGR